MEIAASQIQARMMEFMAPVQNQEGLIKQEFNKGVVTGLRIMTEMVSYHTATMKSLMEREEKRDERDSEDAD